MKVLIVEDSPPTRDLLVRSLSEAGIEASTVARYATGLRRALTESFDVIVLDLMLPDGDGLELCREVRAAGITTPILCVTARSEVGDRVAGLDAGADDYLRKPFALAELQARLRALARRGGKAPVRRLKAGSLEIDFASRRVMDDGTDVPLTAREWAVLEVLVARRGQVVPRAALLEEIWHEVTAHAADSLDVILSRLRRKLGKGSLIRTVRGEGVSFEAPA